MNATQNWRHKTVSSILSEQAEVREMSWEEAQSWCNFVLMKPEELPPDLELASAQMRPEAPPGRSGHLEQRARPAWTQSNRAVHRIEYAGHGRRLRIKQFLYDYAPPAFDHPCLWESDKIRPFRVGRHIGWHGTDFRKLQAATVCLDRTTVELAGTEGNFMDEEMEAICVGLTPAVSGSRDLILATPFAELCYQRRHREPPIAVPVGYWAHKRGPESLRVTVVPAAELRRGLFAGKLVPPLAKYGYTLDSAFIYGDPETPQEGDFIYQHADDAGRYLRLLVSPAGQAGGIPYPPVRELRQPCSNQILKIGDCIVYHACHNESYGQHEAVWQRENHNFMLIVKPTIQSNVEWVKAFLEGMIKAS